jgi:hypothetical protein
VTGQGFGGDVSQATPSRLSGTVLTASWAFLGLEPGLYRVFATWPAGPDRTSRAPFSIFDGSAALRSIPFVNEQNAPVGGPKAGPIVFQQLGGTVNITSGTLRVNLSNVVSDGTVVVADAIRVERLAGTISPGGVGQDVVGALGVSEFVGLEAGSTYRVDFLNTAPGVNSVDFLQARDVEISDSLLVLSASSFSPPAPGTAFPIITVDSKSSIPGVFDNVNRTNDTIELDAGDGGRHTFSINYAAGDGNDIDLVYQNTFPQVRDLTLSPDVINEGGRVTLRGALTDPDRGDVLSLRVDWGDGAVQTFTDLGTNPFHFTHVYADDRPDGAPYLVRVTWFDQHGVGNSAELSVTVKNVPPQLFLGGTEVVRAGEVMQHTGRFTDPGADTWWATVDYGDGSGVQPLVVGPGQTLLFEHRYSKPGKYRVTVTIFDDDGGLSTDSFLVIVLPSL